MDTPLKDVFQNLFNIKKWKRCVVADKCNRTNGRIMWKDYFSWEWKELVNAEHVAVEFQNLVNLISNYIFRQGGDRWVLGCNPNEDFSMVGVKKFVV